MLRASARAVRPERRRRPCRHDLRRQLQTFLLTHWVARPGAPVAGAGGADAQQRNAAYLGLADRGCIAPGQRADLNLIDPARLALPKPQLVRDLPAGGKRFLQKAQGYVGPGSPGGKKA
jgi:N-acyl-D-aspartate/D-glutamate deacylase